MLFFLKKLTLALLVPGVLAEYADDVLAFDDLASLAHSFYRCSHFHILAVLLLNFRAF